MGMDIEPNIERQAREVLSKLHPVEHKFVHATSGQLLQFHWFSVSDDSDSQLLIGYTHPGLQRGSRPVEYCTPSDILPIEAGKIYEYSEESLKTYMENITTWIRKNDYT